MPDEKTVPQDEMEVSEETSTQDYSVEKEDNPYDPPFEFVRELYVRDFLGSAIVRENDPDDIELDMIARALGWRFGKVVSQDGWWYDNRLLPAYRDRCLDISLGSRELSPGATQLHITLPSGEKVTMRRRTVDDMRGLSVLGLVTGEVRLLERLTGMTPEDMAGLKYNDYLYLKACHYFLMGRTRIPTS